MKVFTRLVLGASLLFASIANANVILSLDTDQSYGHPGDVISVSVRIDNLGDYVALSLASYDLDVTFDTNALSFIGYNLFDELGGVADALDTSYGEYAAGVVGIGEFSFISNFDLWNFQPGGFVLAELLFSVNALAGNRTTDLSFTYADLIDVNGDVINIVGINNASIEVPAPSTVLLMGMALLTLFVRQKNTHQLSKKS